MLEAELTSVRFWVDTSSSLFASSFAPAGLLAVAGTHRMTARKILALPNVMQQAAPGNVSTCGLPERCSIV